MKVFSLLHSKTLHVPYDSSIVYAMKPALTLAVLSAKPAIRRIPPVKPNAQPHPKVVEAFNGAKPFWKFN
jgi:hypothetical protein